jgi:hypothetical protein
VTVLAWLLMRAVDPPAGDISKAAVTELEGLVVRGTYLLIFVASGGPLFTVRSAALRGYESPREALAVAYARTDHLEATGAFLLPLRGSVATVVPDAKWLRPPSTSRSMAEQVLQYLLKGD